MIFEKHKKKRLSLVGYTFIGMLFVAYLIYCTFVIRGDLGNYDPTKKISFIDLINGIAQIATASTFVLAFIQYRKNSIQQRQLSIAEEAKSQLEKMILVISQIKAEKESCLKNFNESISSLSNLAINFDELFKAMNEDIQRSIVRMLWQDMFFNHLRPVLKKIDLVSMLLKETSLSDEILRNAASKAAEAAEKDRIIPIYRDYVFTRHLLNNPEIKSNFSLKGKIDALDMFVFHFLNDHNLNDLLYGLLSRVDIKACAPLLAVAEPNDWALEKPK